MSLIRGFPLFLLLAACSSSTAPATSSTDAAAPLPPIVNGSEDGDPRTQAVHALGVVVVGELHGAAAPLTSYAVASFHPDALEVPSCATVVSEACVLVDRKCAGNAQPSPSARCALGDPANGACVPGAGDAGVLRITGTTSPLTLPAPYALESDDPTRVFFLGGETLRVESSGATTDKGLVAFDTTVQATTMMSVTPALSTITPEILRGDDVLSLTWTPNGSSPSDLVDVTLASGDRTVVCHAKDRDGTIRIPVAARRAVLPEPGNTVPFSSVLAVARRHRELHTDARTRSGDPAWLLLETESIENAVVSGCIDGGRSCGTTCAYANETCP